MSGMGDYLLECQELLKSEEFEKLLNKLKPWGSDAPNQLWAVVAFLVAQENPEIGYIEYEEDAK